MTTLKLYQNNPYIKEFQANITKIDKKSESEVHIKLNKTAFYPEGGGQPSDLGQIGDCPVTKVFEQDGDVYHVVSVIPNQFENIQCRIDWNRRFDFMQQHLGQHILSASFEKLFEAKTIGFHLTENNLTIDIDKPIEAKDLRRIEFFANQIIYGNMTVKTHYPANESELASFPLRKDMSVHKNPRIIEIDQFDYSPCGGTHPKRTGEVGIIKITGYSVHRDGLRIEFLCGNRALNDYARKNLVLSKLKSELSCHENDLPARCMAMKDEIHDASANNKKMSEQLLSYQFDEMMRSSHVHNGHRLVRHLLETENVKDANRLTSKILSNDPSAIVIIACPGKDRSTILLSASQSFESLDLSEILKDLIGKYNGRGGGKANHAQGVVSGDVSCETLLQQLYGKIELELEKN